MILLKQNWKFSILVKINKTSISVKIFENNDFNGNFWKISIAVLMFEKYQLYINFRNLSKNLDLIQIFEKFPIISILVKILEKISILFQISQNLYFSQNFRKSPF